MKQSFSALKHVLYGTLFLSALTIMIEGSESKTTRKFVAKSSSSGDNPFTDTRTFITDFISLHTLKMIGLLVLPILLVFPLFVFGGILLLFLPIPILSNPVTGIAAVGRRYTSQDGIDVLMQELYDSPQCIERISCEVGRSISLLEVRGIIDQALNDLSPYMKSKWKGTIHGYVKGSNGIGNSHNVCSVYTCDIVSAAPASDWSF